MSTHISAVPTSAPNIVRPIANFQPTVWGDRFLNCASDLKTIDIATNEQYAELKEAVRRMITTATDEFIKKLDLIDTVQRLGVSYLFENEIEYELVKIHNNGHDTSDLYSVSLRFRLLRQQGIKISCDVFEKFKDDEGKFMKSLIHNVQGMLSLYEAAHLSIRGEDILDEAIDFTTTHLKSFISHESQVSPNLANKISHALNRPLRKGLPRLEARYFMSIYEPGDDLHNKTLLKFAKLDFNLLQRAHKNELSTLTRWWKYIDFTANVSYARDRLVELYFWMMGVYFEPQYALGRIFLTKVIYLISIIDDTYDAYGTFEEVTLFTKAVERWNMGAIDILPEYMKIIYKTLLDTYDEVDEELIKEGSPCGIHVHYAIESTKKCIKAYFAEAIWCKKNYIPTYEEYMAISIVSCAYPLLATNCLLGMGVLATKEAFDWLSNNPRIVTTSSTICRLMDDLASRELEQKREHVASSIECYMKQHGVSREDVVEVFQKEIVNGWKDVNQDLLKPTVVAMPILERVLNLTRVMDLLYKDDDCYTNAHLMKDHIASLLLECMMF